MTCFSVRVDVWWAGVLFLVQVGCSCCPEEKEGGGLFAVEVLVPLMDLYAV